MTIPLLCLSLRAGSHPRFADIDTSPFRSWENRTAVELGGPRVHLQGYCSWFAV
jgi:hypothetical protein